MDKAGRTRRAYIVEALLEYMIALLVIDAFLAAILKQVGVSDAVTGIVRRLFPLRAWRSYSPPVLYGADARCAR